MDKEYLQNLKESASAYSNDCGGCETCYSWFGDGKMSMDPREVYDLITYIEELQEEIAKLKGKS